MIWGMSVVLAGFLASLVAGLFTGLGALPAALVKKVTERKLDVMLGFAAGVMLAATSFSLIVPGIEYGDEMWPGKGVYAVAVGMLIGGLFLDRADKWLPHEHFVKGHEGPESRLRKIWLFIIAITLHNFPEGLAVGVGFGAAAALPPDSPEFAAAIGGAVALAIGIGLQNAPEGLAVAMPLMGEGYTRRKAIWIATATGLVEPVGGLLGVVAVAVFRPLLPFGLAFAAGAMLFVICDEIIPETHGRGFARQATFGVMVGFVVMMAMDNLLG